MPSSVRFRLIVGAALLLSLGGKAALSRTAPDGGNADFVSAAVDTLRQQGFVVTREVRPFATVIHAQRGDCRLLAAEYRAHGTMAEPLAALATPVGPLRFIWRGETREAAPKIAPLMHFYVRRELRRIGFAPDHLPITAVAASRGCKDPVDWGALAALPA
ncbi:hypothetical protein E2493_04615 [Sphingomonas parva]|uniref:Uncharacterized protein n=1 Tax=Sphingomonas parva TaxID=2555898 RepID=A0A4Y8ZTV7_9SPHN|nr:hypothetical protein [Sphingomonas parva]TFI59478.1 hypothetical protein E2493_04615 [Sphingomonas parva]